MNKELLILGSFLGLCALALSSKQQKLQGGIGDYTDEEDVDAEELEMGEEVEMEHTDDPDVAHEIALDHLTEDDHYYTHLKEMEDKYKKKSKR